tara:strand:- start:23 stop:256 length:234 start_codon:yes stop_codon:yes gene_type:complete
MDIGDHFDVRTVLLLYINGTFAVLTARPWSGLSVTVRDTVLVWSGMIMLQLIVITSKVAAKLMERRVKMPNTLNLRH